jgi:hypothetical protein
MDLQAFTKLLSRRLYPLLRKEGFKGSGTTLRRIDGPLVQVFNMQGSSGGARCYINLGAHLSFLSAGEAGNWQPEKVSEAQCAFRDRIEPPPEQPFGWAYGASEEEADRNVTALIAAWESQGHAFFARYATYPDDFARLVETLVPDEVHPATCLTMARLALQLGDKGKALALADSGLARAKPQATSLLHVLSQIRETAKAP